jgi:OOP family OmpA-OmpF porin
MKTKMTKQQISLAVACALALGFATSAVQAQTLAPNADRELWTTTGAPQVWKNGFGECWRSAFGPTPTSTAECDPNYRVPVAQAAPAPVVAPAPAPVAAPVVVAIAAPQPVYKKVTLDADALFDFDKAVLRPAGRDTLDKFSRDIQGINPATITAVGHTDRLGTNSYNQELSERRVAAVKTYLVGTGIQANQVQTSAKGETQPVTKADACRGGVSAKLKACLQPDRRVELEVSGMLLQK